MIRTVLSKKLAACFPDIHDEIVQSFEDVLALEDNGEWKAVPAMTTMLPIVCRTSNRLFVGLCRLVDDVCVFDRLIPITTAGRDSDYLELSMQFTVDVMKAAMAINAVPRFLRP